MEDRQRGNGQGRFQTDGFHLRIVWMGCLRMMGLKISPAKIAALSEILSRDSHGCTPNRQVECTLGGRRVPHPEVAAAEERGF